MSKKVFIIHASEDKTRFVIDFARRLRANGVDAWLDKWEMLPGDSLVDKVFEEGIKEADSFIVVLSNNSVNKPWVREELNASFIKRINNNSKIIPVILDDCTVPECLHTTIWEKIDSFENYEESFNRILSSIFDEINKPSMGQTPSYVTLDIDGVHGLGKIDAIIFTEACEKAMSGADMNIHLSDIYDDLIIKNISSEEIIDSLEILDANGYISATRVMDDTIPFFTITSYGFDLFAQTNIKDYNSIINNICFIILNQSLEDNLRIQDATGYPLVIINQILELLESKSLIHIAKAMGNVYCITKVSPELKRKFN